MRREGAVILPHERERRIGIDVPDDREYRVAGVVVPAIEREHIVAGERAQLVRLPDPPPAEAVAVVQQRVQRLGRQRRRRVELALYFLDDDFELARQLDVVDQRARVGIGLDREPLGQAGGREHREVARMIVDRVGVEIPTARHRLLGDRADGTRWGPLEEHVLEDVRDADLRVALVEVAGLDVRHDGDNGRRPIGSDQHREPIGQHSADGRYRAHSRRRSTIAVATSDRTP